MSTRVDGSAIRLTGTVGGTGATSADEESGIISGAVAAALAKVGRTKDVTVYLNSGGGNAYEGAAIHAILSAHKGKKTVIVQGIAASAASVIAMAGDEILMSPGAVMMIHDPGGLTIGTADDHQASIVGLNAIADSMAAIYAERSGKTVAQARADMRREVWLTPQAAVEQGYATGIVAGAKAPPTPAAPTAFDYGRYQHAPASLMALAVAKQWSRPKVVAQPGAALPPIVVAPARPLPPIVVVPKMVTAGSQEREFGIAAMATAEMARANMLRLVGHHAKPLPPSNRAPVMATGSAEAMRASMQRLIASQAR